MAEGETINCDAVKSIVFIYEAAFGLHFLVTNKPRSLGFATVICIDCKWWHIKSVGSYIFFALFYCFLKADEYFSHPTDSSPCGEILDDFGFLHSLPLAHMRPWFIYLQPCLPCSRHKQREKMHFIYGFFVCHFSVLYLPMHLPRVT